MIYPATHDITILQNSTWRGVFRATQNRQQLINISISSSTPTFICTCHGLTAGTKVIFTGGSTVPCGLNLNSVYYVIAAGLTADAFQVSATSGGSSISASGDALGTFYVATPLDLTSYTVDSDVRGLNSESQIMTFSATITDAINGQFQLTAIPATTEPITPGRYGYDVSLTSASGERYYWVKGTATVEKTYSRNT
jgi:hypothetical protein